MVFLQGLSMIKSYITIACATACALIFAQPAAWAQNAPAAANNTAATASANITQQRAEANAEIGKLMQQNQFDAALAKADAYLSGNANDPVIQFQKGVILSILGKTDEAIASFTKMTETYPDIPEPYNNLAILYASKNDLNRARSALEMAIRNKSNYANAHDNLGDLYVKLAAQSYQKNLEIEPNSKPVQAKLQLINAIANLPIGAKKAPGEPEKPAKNKKTPLVTSASASTANASSTATAATPSSNPVAADKTASKASTAASASTAVPREAITETVQAWAKAWSDRNVDAYLSFYHKDFTVGKMSHSQWAQDRKDKISSKDSIEVKVSDLSIKPHGDLMEARFQQMYTSNKLKENSKKILEFTKTSDGWKITKEKVQ